MATARSSDAELEDFVAQFILDPLGFVECCLPWGEPNTPLEHETGPDENQRQFLIDLGAEVRARGFDGHTPVMPILMAETSGHGTGKSALGAWIACWILSTRPGSIGTVTAGTGTQLEVRTWAAIIWWLNLCLTAHWFVVQSRLIYAKSDPKFWKLVAQTADPDNAHSFAGQHARTSTSWYLFDEASGVPDTIWEEASGGLIDGEPMWFAWGQMIKNTGMFYKVCFGSERERWNHRRIDSRTSRFTNKALITRWIDDYGLDSDYCKVRILGYPPSASELQYIDKGRIDAARHRVARPIPGEPLVAGFDVSGGGKAWNVIRFRRGLDGNALPPIRIPGERDPDRLERVGLCAELLNDTRDGHQVAALFIDAAFGAPIAVLLKSLGFTNVYEVQFGAHSPDPHMSNMRAYMYAKAKEWLLLGALPDDENVCEQAALAGYHLNQAGKLVIESKADIIARGEASPDDWDALCLTFAQPVAIASTARRAPRPAGGWLPTSKSWQG